MTCEKINITIIGATKGLGLWIAKQLNKEDYNVTITSRNKLSGEKIAKKINVNYNNDNIKSVENADIIIFSVPIEHMVNTIKEVAPHAPDGSLLIDVSSVKIEPSEALKKYAEIGCTYEVCALLQPTSPLRSGEDIRAAFELFEETKARSLTSVVEVEHPIQWCFTLDDTRLMKDFASSPYRETRRQDLERHYRENGAIYIAKTRDVIDPLFEFYSDQCVAFIMDQRRSIDIDTWQDFLVAEIIMKTTMGANDGFRSLFDYR